MKSFGGTPYCLVRPLDISSRSSDTRSYEHHSLHTIQAFFMPRFQISILQAVHLEGIIHGDIHPGNFTYFPWRDPQMSVRLIDFGAATIHGRKEPKQQHNQVNYSFASAERISSPYKGKFPNFIKISLIHLSRALHS